MNRFHGGDIYRNKIIIDFSINTNPLGIPDEVKNALHGAVETAAAYPDIMAEELKRAVGGMLKLPEEYLLFGNGASELFLAVVHGIKPGKTVIPIPSFYGYEYAAGVREGEIVYYEMARALEPESEKEKAFCLREDFLETLTEDVDLLFLANPNNPTGVMLDRDYLENLLVYCRRREIVVVLDECFIEFCGEGNSMVDALKRFENLVLVRAFTKIFSIPGVRLGYLCSSNRPLLKKIERQLPEWNVSAFAQAAGCACAMQGDFTAQTAAYIKGERRFLEEGLRGLGLKVFCGEANFILVYSEVPLYEELLKKGILIRDCENFRGLSKGFYRIAVRGREENEVLLKAIGEIRWKKERI